MGTEEPKKGTFSAKRRLTAGLWRKEGMNYAQRIHASVFVSAGQGNCPAIWPNCEVSGPRSDLNDPDSSIVAIENGHVTGRKVGTALPCGAGGSAQRAGQSADHLSYLTRTKDGKILKSSTFYIGMTMEMPLAFSASTSRHYPHAGHGEQPQSSLPPAEQENPRARGRSPNVS